MTDERKVPESRCDDAIQRWRQWAMLWATVSTLQWIYIVGEAAGWWP